MLDVSYYQDIFNEYGRKSDLKIKDSEDEVVKNDTSEIGYVSWFPFLFANEVTLGAWILIGSKIGKLNHVLLINYLDLGQIRWLSGAVRQVLPVLHVPDHEHADNSQGCHRGLVNYRYVQFPSF